MINLVWPLCVACCLAQPVIAQETGSMTGADGAQAETPALVDETGFGQQATDQALSQSIPALTVLSVEILAELSSETSKQGDTFPIRLYSPIVINGTEVVPEGTTGTGYVVHAKKKGGMGASGELILTASYLEMGEVQIPLRSLRVDGEATRSRIDTVNAINVASAATVPGLGIVGYFIKGSGVAVPQGTIATVKTARAVDVPVPAETLENVADEASVSAQEGTLQSSDADFEQDALIESNK